MLIKPTSARLVPVITTTHIITRSSLWFKWNKNQMLRVNSWLPRVRKRKISVFPYIPDDCEISETCQRGAPAFEVQRRPTHRSGDRALGPEENLGSKENVLAAGLNFQKRIQTETCESRACLQPAPRNGEPGSPWRERNYRQMRAGHPGGIEKTPLRGPRSMQAFCLAFIFWISFYFYFSWNKTCPG